MCFCALSAVILSVKARGVKRLFYFLFIIFSVQGVWAQLSVNALSTNYTINFDGTVPGVSSGSFTGTGFQATPSSGRLDSDAWKISGMSDGALAYGATRTTGDYARGLSFAPVTTGGVYAFQGAGLSGRAMGIQPTGNDMTPGDIELRIQNNTGNYLHTVNVSYDICVRNDQGRTNFFNGQFNSDMLIAHSQYSTSNYLPIPPFSLTSPLPPTSTIWSCTNQSEVISGILVAPGDYIYVKWVLGDIAGSGNRDEFALDNIVINVEGAAEIEMFSQNSGTQTTALGTMTATTQLWSSLPVSNYSYKHFPFLDDSDYFIQSGNTVRLSSTNSGTTTRNLTIESGGGLRGNFAGTDGLQMYWSLYEDLVVDGAIGLSNANSSNVSFNFEPGAHTISGSGDFYGGRIRKSDLNNNDGICDLDINMDVTLFFPNTALYNNRDAGLDNMFNVTIPAGITLDVPFGDIGMDQDNGTSGFEESGGHLLIEGTAYVHGSTIMSTNNTNLTRPVTIEVANGGRLETGEIICAASGVAGSTLLLRSGSWLEFHGAGALTTNTFRDFSLTNNTYTFEPGSTIEYSKNNTQNLLRTLEYQNLVISGSNNKIGWGVGDPVIIRGDLDIQSGVLRPNANILINGDWNSYSELGFIEGTFEVAFENLVPGQTSISTGAGGELFNNLEIRSGSVDMLSNVDVLTIFDLQSRLNLNSNELIIRQPVFMTLGPVTSAMVVSEDLLHQGRMTVRVNTYSNPVDFPFGTTAGVPIYSRVDLNSGDAGDVTIATYPTAADNLPWPIAPTTVNNLISTTGLLPDNRDATVDRFWSVESTGPNPDMDLTFRFLNSEMPNVVPYNNVALVRAQRYEAPTDKWLPSLPGQLVIPNSPVTNVHTVVVPDVTEFSPWAIASDVSPLPVELLSFEGKAVQEGILLEWQTASESNNSHFELYRFDEIGEGLLGRVDGAGFSSQQQDYDFLDSNPMDGWNQYRLYQVDFDGTRTDEGVISVYWTPSDNQLLQSYVLDSDQLELQLDPEALPCVITIYDAKGALISRKETMEPSVVLRIPRSTLLLMNLESGYQSESHKLVPNR